MTRVSVRLLRIVAAAAVLIGGYCHYHLWDVQYRHTAVKELFVINAVASLLTGLALLIGPRRLAALAGIVLSALTLVAFVLSRNGGVPTFHGTFSESGMQPTTVHVLGVEVAPLTLILEALALLLCLVVLFARPRLRARAGREVGGGVR